MHTFSSWTVRYGLMTTALLAVIAADTGPFTAQVRQLPPPESTAGNVLINGDFENGQYYDDIPWLAGRVWQETHGGSGAGYTGTTFSSPYITGWHYMSVPPNATYTFRGWFRAWHSSLFDLGFEAYDANKRSLGYRLCGGAPTQFAFRVPDVWTRFECTVGWNTPEATRLPPGTAYVRPVVYFSGRRPGLTDNRLFLDDLFVGITGATEGTPTPDPQNLIRNGGFELGTTEGFANMARVIRDSRTGWYAGLSRRLTEGPILGATFIPVNTQRTYQLEGWFWGGGSNATMRFGLAAYDVGLQQIGTESPYPPTACATGYRTVSAPGIWTKYTCTLQGEGDAVGRFPAGTRLVKPFIDITGNAPVRIDDLRFVEVQPGGSSSSSASSVPSSVASAQSTASVPPSSQAPAFGPNLLRNGDFESGTTDNFGNLTGVGSAAFAGTYGGHLDSAEFTPNSMTSIDLMPVPQGADVRLEWQYRRGATPSASVLIGVLAYDANRQPIGRPNGYGFGCGVAMQSAFDFWRGQTCLLRGEGNVTGTLLPGTRYVRFVVWGYGSIQMDNLTVSTRGGAPTSSVASSSASSVSVAASSVASSVPTAAPNLTMTHGASTTTVPPGMQFSQTATVTNTVPGSVANRATVIVSVSQGFQTRLLAGQTFAADNGGICTVDNQRRSVTCLLLVLTSTTPRTITFDVIAPTACNATNNGVATLLSTGDPAFPSQTVTATTTVVCTPVSSSASSAASSTASTPGIQPVLALSRGVSPTSVERGGTLTYSYAVSNTVAGSTALNTFISEILPPDFTPREPLPAGCRTVSTVVANRLNLLCEIGQVTYGSPRTVIVPMAAPQNCAGPHVSTANLTALNAAMASAASPGITVTCPGSSTDLPNLLQNGDFESGAIQPFSGLNGVSTASPHGGVYAGYRNGHSPVTHTQLVPVSPGGSVSFEVWARSVGVDLSLLSVDVVPYDQKKRELFGAIHSCFSVPVQVPREWTKFSCTMQGDATSTIRVGGVRYAALKLRLNQGQGNVFSTQIDDIRYGVTPPPSPIANLLQNGSFASNTLAGYTNLAGVAESPPGDFVAEKHARSGTTYTDALYSVPENAPVFLAGWFQRAQGFFTLNIDLGVETFDAQRQPIGTRVCRVGAGGGWNAGGCSFQFRGDDPTQLPIGIAFVRPFLILNNNVGSASDRLYIDDLELVIPGGAVAPPVAGLTLAKTVSTQTVQRGGSLTYTIRLENTIPGSAVTSANLSDTAPQGFVFSQAQNGPAFTLPNNGGNCTITSASLTCALNAITSATPRVIELTLVAPQTCVTDVFSTATLAAAPSINLTAANPGITVTGCTSSSASSTPTTPTALRWTFDDASHLNATTDVAPLCGTNPRARLFNGTSDYVNGGNGASLDVNRFTFSVWIKAETVAGGYRAILGKGVSPRPPSLWLNNRKIEVWMDPQGLPAAVTNDRISAKTWHHVASVYDGSTVRIFVDGTLAATAAYAGTPVVNTQNLAIGQRGDGSFFFHGIIDDVRLFSQALSDGEIQELARRCDGSSSSATTSTVSSAASSTVPPVPALTLAKTVSTQTVQRGGSLTYTIRLENTVPGSTVASASLTDTAPQGFVFQVPSIPNFVIPNGGACSMTVTSLSCSMTAITSATPRVIELTLVAPQACGGPLTSTATVSATPSTLLTAANPGITVTGCAAGSASSAVSSASSSVTSGDFVQCPTQYLCTKVVSGTQCNARSIDCAPGSHLEGTGTWCGTPTCAGTCGRCVPDASSSSSSLAACPIPNDGPSVPGSILPYPAAVQNLLPNGGFESGAAGGYDGFAVVSGGAHTGTYSAERYALAIEPVRVPSSGRFTIDYWVKSAGSCLSALRTGVYVFNQTGAYLGTSACQPTSANMPRDWTRYTCVYERAHTTAQIRVHNDAVFVQPFFFLNDGQGGSIYNGRIDDIRMYAGTPQIPETVSSSSSSAALPGVSGWKSQAAADWNIETYAMEASSPQRAWYHRGSRLLRYTAVVRKVGNSVTNYSDKTVILAFSFPPYIQPTSGSFGAARDRVTVTFSNGTNIRNDCSWQNTPGAPVMLCVLPRANLQQARTAEINFSVRTHANMPCGPAGLTSMLSFQGNDYVAPYTYAPVTIERASIIKGLSCHGTADIDGWNFNEAAQASLWERILHGMAFVASLLLLK